MQATVSCEIELVVTGTFVRGYPAAGPSYASGGEPGEPDSVEDVEADDVGVLPYTAGPTVSTGSWSRMSILDGVDRTNPEVRKLIGNLLSVLHVDVETALLDAA